MSPVFYVSSADLVWPRRGKAEVSRSKHWAGPTACSGSGWEVGGLSAHLFLEEPTPLLQQLNQLLVLCLVNKGCFSVFCFFLNNNNSSFIFPKQKDLPLSVWVMFTPHVLFRFKFSHHSEKNWILNLAIWRSCFVSSAMSETRACGFLGHQRPTLPFRRYLLKQ